MIYKRGEFGISVEQIDGFGKNPGLWIHEGNCATKVASFGNTRKAERFLQFLDYLILINGNPPKEDDDADK